MPPEAPAPVAARLYQHRAVLEVDWSVFLRQAVIPPGEFGATVATPGIHDWDHIVAGFAIGRTSTVPLVINGIAFGVDRCRYNAVAQSIVSRAGVPAAAFINFPCAVLP